MAAPLEDHDAGPESSPYLSPTYHLIFENKWSFAVPLALLEPIPKLRALFSSWKHDAEFDFPQEAGHILVHYLHTGRYQTLRHGDLARGTLLGNPLKVGLCSYSIAQTYEVSGLTNLAKERVVYFSDQLSPLNFLLIVKSVSQWLASSADDTWLYDLVRSRVHRLFEDPKSLDRGGYLGLFEPPGILSKMLPRAMIEELCCLKTSIHTPSTSSAEAAPLVPEPPELVDVLDELELPKPFDTPDEVLEQPVEPEPEPEPTEDARRVVAQSEFTWQAGPSSLWLDQLLNASQAEATPASRLSKKKLKKKMKKKAKLSLAGDCPNRMLDLLGEGEGKGEDEDKGGGDG